MKTYLTPFLILAVSCQVQPTFPDLIETSLSPEDSISMEKLSIHSLNGLVLGDSSFILLDRLSKTVVVASRNFDFKYQIKSTGRGPGEFTDPFDVSAADGYIYVLDFEQRKIIEFDDALSFKSEFIVEEPFFSALALGKRVLWAGAFDFQFEDVYRLDFTTLTQTRLGTSTSVDIGLEGITFHSKHPSGAILRYRQFNHRLDLLDSNGVRFSFVNPTRPERPELDPRSPDAPIFRSKIHHSAFVTADRACVLSGDHSPGNQPVQCFDFEGRLVARYSLTSGASMISVYADSTLYTYSPSTNHVYVYSLGF